MKRDIFFRTAETVLIASMILFCWIVSMDGIRQRKQIKDLQDQITELASKTDAGVSNVSKKVLDLMYTTTQTESRVKFIKEDLASMTDAMEDQREELPDDRGGIMEIDNEEVKHIDDPNPVPTGPHLTPASGVFEFEGHTETYYNLPMDVVVQVAHSKGICGEYHVRSDGAKMIGDYIMVAACYDVHPYGSLVNTSLGMGIVVDTGAFTAWNSGNVDIAVTWN